MWIEQFQYNNNISDFNDYTVYTLCMLLSVHFLECCYDAKFVDKLLRVKKNIQ